MDRLCTHRFGARRVLGSSRAHHAFRWTVVLGVLTCCLWTAASHGAERPDVQSYKSYVVKHKTIAEAEAVLAEMLAGYGEEVQIVADTKSNRLLLSGSAQVQRIATKVLSTFDQPPPVKEAEVTEATLKSYVCPKSRLDHLVTTLRQRYAENEGVRIAADSTGERLLVLATPDVHTEIGQLIDSKHEESEDAANPPSKRPSSPALQKTTASRERKVRPGGSTSTEKSSEKSSQRDPDLESLVAGKADDESPDTDGDEVYGLLHINANTLMSSLQTLLGDRLEAVGKSKSDYQVTVGDEATTVLQIHRRQNQVTLSGHPALSAQVSRLIRSLDVPKDSGAELTKVLPLEGIDADDIEKIKQALQPDSRNGSLSRDKSKTRRIKGERKGVKNAAHHSGDHDQFSTIRLVANQVSAPVNADPGLMDDAAGRNSEGLPDEMESQLRRLGSDLEIEALPDLDAIILRGNKPDIEEMTRILKELERLSLETDPSIEVYPLEHVRGDSLSVLIEKVNTDLTGSLQGRVTVTPLIVPNSLLIIGWGESVRSVRELIEKLDQPVPPESQFQVFRLKHADVAQLRTAFQDFFAARSSTGGGTGSTASQGLAPKVQVTADTRTNSLIVQASPRDMLEATKLVEELDVPSGAVVHQARIFTLKNTLAADLVTVIQSAIDAARGREGNANTPQKSSVLEFLSIDKEGRQVQKSAVLNDVKVTAEPRTNSLLVSAPPESMELIASLIQRLDEASSDGAQIKVFRVINGDAISLVQMLRSLLPPPTGPAGTPQLANSRDESSLVPARFSVDLRTNSIIATGSTGDLRIIEALLLRLDQKDIEQRKNTVYRLKNAPAEAVARSVNDFLRSERTVAQAAPGAISPFQQIESEVVVVPEPVSNSLIISATPRFFDEIEVLVEKLDAQPPQVMIQVLIAQVTLNNTNEFGVELGLQDSLLFDRSLLGNLVTTTSTIQQSSPSGILTSTTQNILGATNTPGFLFNGAPLGNSGSPSSLATSDKIGGQAVSNFGVSSVNSQLGYGGLVLSASSENVSVLIRALQQSNRLEVLSRPQIRTLDNQPAFIQIGQRVPRIYNASVTQVGSVNGVLLENVGLILGVTPRISPEGMVVMEVDAEKSEIDVVDPGIPVSVSASGAVIRSPIFNITTASTTVSANSGETIIIGGLITKSNNDTVRRVPYLSDIPVLGNLFRYDSSISQRTELLIVLTPYVIRGPEESARIKREEAAKMHWCAGDVVDIYGPGIISDDPGPFPEADIPIIYPDLNPRGTLVPMEVPPEPVDPAPLILDDETVSQKTKKSRKSGFFPLVSQKKRK